MRIVRLMGVALVLAPAMALAQAKPVEKKPMAKPAMQHDMSKMSHDTGMKHDMAGMGQGQGMGEMKSGWNELDAFHTLLMSVSSAANKGDLKPARAKGAELSKAADAWLASKGPASCDNAAITKAHDSFRPVAQSCMMAGMGKAPAAKKP